MNTKTIINKENITCVMIGDKFGIFSNSLIVMMGTICTITPL